jgi:hypothetical protein
MLRCDVDRVSYVGAAGRVRKNRAPQRVAELSHMQRNFAGCAAVGGVRQPVAAR